MLVSKSMNPNCKLPVPSIYSSARPELERLAYPDAFRSRPETAVRHRSGTSPDVSIQVKPVRLVPGTMVVRSKYSCGFPMIETEQPAKPFTGAHLALGLR